MKRLALSTMLLAAMSWPYAAAGAGIQDVYDRVEHYDMEGADGLPRSAVGRDQTTFQGSGANATV